MPRKTKAAPVPATRTPGPWTYRATAGKHDFAIYPESSGRDIALVRDFNEANAQLIAAAPELYDALRQMVLNTQAEPFIAASLKKARAALATAEGR